jgi:hypothetical protein
VVLVRTHSEIKKIVPPKYLSTKTRHWAMKQKPENCVLNDLRGFVEVNEIALTIHAHQHQILKISEALRYILDQIQIIQNQITCKYQIEEASKGSQFTRSKKQGVLP